MQSSDQTGRRATPLQPLLVQVHVGGRDYADVYVDGQVAAHRLNFTMIEDPKQSRLKCRGKVAHFIKKYRAAFGYKETSFSNLVRAGKELLSCPNNSSA